MKEPKTSFKEFEGEWESIPFSQIMNRVSNSGQAGTLPGVEFEDIVSGEGQLNRDIYQKECNKYGKLFQSGDILFGKLRPYLKNILLADFEGIAIGDFWVLRSIENDSKYLYTLVNTDSFMKIANTSTGSKMPRADWNLVSSTDFTISSDKNEQIAIGKFFTTIDAQISASTSRLASLKQIKAASLQAMFPQEGETVPKLRFKGFEGEWEEITLGEIAPLVGGYAFKSANFEKTGIPIVRISNILDSGVVGGDFAKYKCFEGDTSFRLYDGDTVIAMSGATTGKVAVVKTQTFLYQNQRVGKFSRTDKIFYTFVSIFVGSKKFANALDRKLTASAQPNASSKDIDSIKLSFPSSKDEQQRIASYFTNLDRQINLQSQRLEKLKQIKAACLDKMFV